MPSSRFVPPKNVTLPLTDGATITVRDRLNTGEVRALMRAEPDSKSGLEKSVVLITAYLVDWTLTDERGAIVPIRGLDAPTLEATLDALDLETFYEVANAIGAHIRAVVEARAEEKKILTTDPELLPT